MMGHGAIGIAALLSASALGYLVCAKANTEKKGSNLRVVGLGLGALIIILGLLGSLCLIAKSGFCPLTSKLMGGKMIKCDMGQQAGPCGPVCQK